MAQGPSFISVRSIAIAACLWSGQASAQPPYWAKDFGGTGADHVADVQVDTTNAVYIVGDFSTTLTVDGQTLVSSGQNDVFVAKLDAAGSLVWLRSAGGAGIDVGTKLALGPDGAVVVCGEFAGTADLFGNILSSNGNTTDMFVARLSAEDGSTFWVRTGGSDTYSDRASGVAISADGNVIATGEFKGSAVFDAGILVSEVDPGTLLPSFDVFVCSWNASGAPQWIQQGSAKKDDQAVEVVTDAQNNIYVTGQFSDTITFDVEHPTISFNNIFLVKFDPNGAEQWFRRCGGGTYNHVNDMRLSDNGQLLLCGDVEGTMYWIDVVPVAINNPSPFAFFLLKVGANGSLVQNNVMGSQNPVSGDALQQSGATIAVLGTFTCAFTGLQTAYDANGIFMATGARDLHVTRFHTTDLTFSEAQQFGGHGSKRAGAIAAFPDGALVFTGSYDEQLFYPSDGASWGEQLPCGIQTNNLGITLCGDAYYGRFVGTASIGLNDGFVSKAYVIDREPYDFWDRTNNGPCDRPELGAQVCVKQQGLFPCVDTLQNCGAVYLAVNVPFYEHFNLCPVQEEAGFPIIYQWSTGQQLGTIYAPTTGWYWCTVSSANGCWQYTDSMYVEIDQPSQALLSDGTGTYTAQPPAPPYLPLFACDSTWLWCSSFAPTDVVYWVHAGDTVPGDSILAGQQGLYSLVVEAESGCIAVNTVYYFPQFTEPMPNITSADIALAYNGTPLTQLDTIYTCGAFCVNGAVDVTWYIDSLPGTLSPGLSVDYSTSTGCISGTQPIWSVILQGDGWHTIDLSITLSNAPCGPDTLVTGALDSLYIINLQPPVIMNPGPIVHCPGDTLQLPVQCTACDSIAWSGPGIVSMDANGDTVFVNEPGVYEATAYNLGVGVACAANMLFLVQEASSPMLYIIPWNAIICPNDSALLYTTSIGVSYDWQGPSGPLAVNNDSVWIHEAGAYFLSVQMPGGCTVSNGPISLNVYASPFISAQPDAVICEGESVDLEVVLGNNATISWLPPLTGDQPLQTVDSAGTYQCIVTSCGVEWPLSITIFSSALNADLGPGPWTICGDEVLVIDGPPGGDQYLWLPDSLFTQSIALDSSQQVQLVMFDNNGCIDSSDVIDVTWFQYTEPLTCTVDTVCMGEYAYLFASGSGTIMWYGDTLGSQPIAVGPSIYIGPVLANTTIYATQQEGDCISGPVPSHAYVLPLPPLPDLQGDSLLCYGDTLLLSVSAVSGTTYLWSTPQGTSTDLFVTTIDTLGSAAGMYTLVAHALGCTSDTLRVNVVVDPCIVDPPDTTAADTLMVPNIFSPNDDGVNDAITLVSPGSEPLNWNVWNRWGQLVYTMSAKVVKWDGRNALTGEVLPEGVYFIAISGVWRDGSPLAVQGYVHLVR